MKINTTALALALSIASGAAGQQVDVFMQSRVAYPPRQKSFDVDIDAMMGAMYEAGSR